tara:strand:+ start:183 stop:428 length:246 start_codon:yes stop_codon:yes gene_type:complete
MKLKKKKLSLLPLCGKVDSETFATAQALRDIVDAVEPMHSLATARVATDGQFAKLYADQVAERLENIFKLANDRLSAILEA